ncbi:MAG: hypothetical protein GWN84_15105, partial [Gammaproteobacteria bacterium]|nr:hypothetical protein [Gammaproteobacteria bacterium]NIR30605.1 hypothetical protein [Gammaproteobacteria bacterium]NIU05274.1 hypothetical protein [Gammaproteobacteria bacterium]NIV52214.1 hypothetical protein [Gammaproteobacteria bacterium]NIX86547.1 hypothetical protein [Gammaproteobacteria bacterium]
MSSIERIMRRKRADGGQDVPPESGFEAKAKVPVARRPHPLDESERQPDIHLDHQLLTTEGLLTPEDESAELREQYRLVKRKLITQAFVR